MIENRTDWHEDESLFHGVVPRVMGTRLEVLMVHPDIEMLSRLWRDVAGLLESMDRVFDRFAPDSEVSRLNSRSRDIADISPVMEDASGCAVTIMKGHCICLMSLSDIFGMSLSAQEKSFSAIRW